MLNFLSSLYRLLPPNPLLQLYVLGEGKQLVGQGGQKQQGGGSRRYTVRENMEQFSATES
jgi:hypothetical protein